MTLTPKQKRAPNDFKTAWRNMSSPQRVEAMEWLASKCAGTVNRFGFNGRVVHVDVLNLRIAGSFK